MDRNQAFVDPNAIDEATVTLERFVSRLRDFENSLGHELDRLGTTFQDEAFEEFHSAFMQTRKMIVAFADQTTVILPSMREDAEKIRRAQSLKHNN